MSSFQLNFLVFPILFLLCGVGLLLLSLYYLKRKQRNVNQGQAKRQRKGGTLKGWKAGQSEVEEARKVLSLLQSLQGQHHDTIRFRELLCPDPSCEMCNNATAEVNRLLYPEALEDATPLASTTPVTESSYSLSPDFSVVPPRDPILTPQSEPFPLPPHIFYPNRMTPLVDFVSSLPLGYPLPQQTFLTMGPKFPVDYSPPQSLALPSLLSHDIQRVDSILQQETTSSLNTFSSDPTLTQDTNSLPGLSQITNPTDSFVCQHIPPILSVSPSPDCPSTVIQSTSIFTSLKPVPEDSSKDGPDASSTHVPTIRDIDHSNLSISDISCWQVYAKNMFFPTLSHSGFQKEHVLLHLPEPCFWGDSVSDHMEASSHSFLGINIQALLERQVKKREAFQILENQGNEEGPFSRQIWSEYQQASSGNLLQPLHVQNTTVPQTGWNCKDKPEQLRNSQKFFYAKTLRENLQQKYSQLFWGLPSLHSESLVATFLVSRSSSSHKTRFVLFNGICNACSVKMQHQESPQLSHFHFLPLFNADPQHLPQIKSQSQSFTQVQPQPHFQSQLSNQPSSSPSQIRDSGLSFQRSQNESDSNILNTNQHLECHMLQKQQGSLQGLVPILRKSQDATCPQTPNLPLVSRLSHAYVPVSIPPGHFHITSEPQKKLQVYVPRRSIPFMCFHTCGNLQPLGLMAPQCKLTENSHQKGRHAHLKLSGLQSQSSNSLDKRELSFPGSVCESVPQKFQLKKDVRRNLGYILERSPEDSPHRVSECYLVKGRRATSDIKSICVCHSVNHLGNELLNVSGKDTDQNQVTDILRLHLSKKSCQITENRIPIGVCHSWLAEDNTLPPFGSSQTNMENTNSKNAMTGRVYCKITSLELSFLDPNTRQVLEAHIIRFRMSQRWGLPLKVVESIKLYTLREAKTWPLPQYDCPSSATHVSGAVSKAEVSKPHEESSRIFQGNKQRTIKSVSILDRPFSAFSYESSEGQGVLKTSHTDMGHKLAENTQTIARGSQSFQPLTHNTMDKGNQSETVLGNTCSPEMPMKQTGAGHEPSYENVSSNDREELIQFQEAVDENLEHFSISNMFREIFKAQELCDFKSQSRHILTTQGMEGSQMINVNTNKAESILTTECPSSKISGPQDSKLSNLKMQRPKKQLKFKLESEEQSQAQGFSPDMSLTSDSLPSMSPLIQSWSISNGDMGASQGPHVHWADSKISTGLRQESWVSKKVSWKCQDNNVPPAEKKVKTLGFKGGECGNEDSNIRISKAGKKSDPVEDRVLEGTSTFVSQNERFPHDSYFRQKMRQIFQWINSKRKIKGLETLQQKAKFMSPFEQEHDPSETAAIFLNCGLPEAHELMTAIGKILEEKLANRHQLETFQLSQQK